MSLQESSQFGVNRILVLITKAFHHILPGENIRQFVITIQRTLLMSLPNDLHVIVHVVEILLSHDSEKVLLGSILDAG